MEEEQPISDLEDPSEEELQQMKSEYEKMKKQQQEIESLQKFQFFKKTQVDLSRFVTRDSAQTITGTKTFTQPIVANSFIKTDGTQNQILLANGGTSDVDDFLPKHYPHAMEQMIIEPDNDMRNQGLRIMKNKANWDSFVLTGCNNDRTDRDGVWKMGSTSSQFRIQKQEDDAYDYKGLIIDFDCTSLKFNNQLIAPLPTPPIENAIKSTIAYGMYESLVWGSFTKYNGRAYISLQITHNNPKTQTQSAYTLFSGFKDEAKPQFTGTPFTILLNAVRFEQKVICYPICWNGAIPIDSYIDVDGHVRINTLCQLVLPDNFCVQVCDSYAVYNQSAN
ncbi:MAG: hypothetical protein EZS28_021640 [Streblomastix strix]|uniref:Uncharacterized protein n=1 Tax=Streblomastix strix TaxID=222440 RepID=A0A5J4VK47_9EUKA|nr:MAG: hypothetical protein EZS28_021640 [Streblomastix strix]